MAPVPRPRRRGVVHVFTEGEVTEPEYIDWITQQQDRFAVRVDDRHGPPQRLVKLAMRLRKRGHGDELAIWCVFDRDQHQAVDEAIDAAERAGIRVAFSHPCFEYWLLLHFCDTATPCAGNCGGADRRLERELAGYRKAVAVSWLASRLQGRFAEAKARAVRIRARHDRDGVILPTQRDPSTNVWELVERIGVDY